MVKIIHRATNSQQSQAQLEALLLQLGEAGSVVAAADGAAGGAAADGADGGAVLITTTHDRAIRFKKHFACRPFMFGLSVTTLVSWVSERWSLFGDGRRIVSSLERELILHKLMSDLVAQGELKHLGATPGTAKMLASMAQEALSALTGEQAVFHQMPHQGFLLTEAEKEACFVLERYVQTLNAAGWCELAQAFDCLAASNMPLPMLFFEGFDCFSDAQQRFIDALSEKTTVHVILDEATGAAEACGRATELLELQQRIFNPTPASPLVPGGAVRFLFPTGYYAKARLLAQTITEHTKALPASSRKTDGGDAACRFIVSASDPADLFKRLAGFLTAEGIEVRVSAQQPFSSTAFGKAFLALLEFCYAPYYSTFLMSDFTLSSFSGISRQKAYELDAQWRANRLCDKKRCLDDIARESPRLKALVDALSKKDIEGVLDIFEEGTRRDLFKEEVFQSEQLSAIALARSFFETVSYVKLKPFEVLNLLSERRVTYRCRSLSVKTALFGAEGAGVVDGASEVLPEADGAPVAVVDLMSLDEVSAQDACSCDVLILCDLESFSYPVRDSATAKTLLFDKLGIEAPLDALTRMRRQFFRALSTPKHLLVCERVLNTADAEPAYPAVVLDELADCYRSNLSSYEGVDKRTALPDSLLAYAAFSGEDRLYENLFAQGACPQQGTVEHLLETGAVSDAAREMIVLPALPKEGAPAQEVAQPVFSPSAIESYLECPYKWFSLRRLRLEGLDGGFGALEKGSFSHNVLKLFYEEFQREGFEKVSAENIETARGLLVKLFDERLEAQSTLKRNENPLIALSELEKAEIDVLKRQLLAYLAREATFLSGFTPRYFETSFGRSESFVYAAQRFCGSIDRIDVNDKGQAVVIDYKTSLSKDYALAQGSDLVWLAAAADGERVAGENDGTDGADGTSDNDEGDGTRGTPKSLLLPHKIQALIYAQAARKLLGLDVVGALYVSLGASGTIAGAIDSLVLGPADISGIEVKTCSVQEVGASNFGALLDAVEEMIAPALACLLEGHIAPDPRGSDPCGFCPVSACGLRV